MTSVDPEVLALAHEMARETADQGARAALLMGSRVRGDAYPESDVDLTFIGPDRECRLHRRRGFLVSEYWRSADSIRQSLRDPAAVGGLVPALRRALVIRDPEQLAAHLQQEAEAWTWDLVSDQCDAWVAEQVASFAEEVHRLAGHRTLGRLWPTAAMRCVLSCRMGMVLAVHLRILYDTENRLWDLVGQAMGDQWNRAQSAAFGIGGESFAQSCAGALELFALAAAKAYPLFDERQRRVVSHACALAGFPLGEQRV